MLARNRGDQVQCEPYDYATIWRTPPAWIPSTPVYVNPVWRRFARSVVRKIMPHIIIVRDIPLGPLAIDLARSLKIPVILDMAENYPEVLRIWRKYQRYQPIRWVINDLRLPARIEEKCVRCAAKVIVVVEEQRQRLVQQYRIPEERVAVVGNTPDLATVRAAPSTCSDRVLSYIGGLAEERGIETLLMALKLVLQRGHDWYLDVVGDGPTKPEIRRMVQEFLIEPRVKLVGYVEHSMLFEYYNRAAVGVIPHYRNAFTDTTMPNKFYDYLAYGKPVIVSNTRPLERLTNEIRCGLVFTSGSHEELADRIIRMEDESLRQEMAENGRKVVWSELNWLNDERELITAVEDVVCFGRSPGTNASDIR